MAAESDEIIVSKMSWNAEIDEMLAGWCDQAKSFEWMHAEGYRGQTYRFF